MPLAVRVCCRAPSRPPLSLPPLRACALSLILLLLLLACLRALFLSRSRSARKREDRVTERLHACC